MDLLDLLQLWKADREWSHRVNPRPMVKLVTARADTAWPYKRKVLDLRVMVEKAGITEQQLIELAIAERRLHPDRRSLDPGHPEKIPLLRTGLEPDTNPPTRCRNTE